MKLITGLGNPGKEYENTRHNCGFEVCDILAKKYGAGFLAYDKNARIARIMIGSEKVILLKPQTYMNSSGIAIRAVADFYKIDTSDIIVVYDDISLDIGQIRIRSRGSAGGHNGMKSVISHLGSDVFDRIKVGVGEKPEGYDLINYVLGHFSKEERDIMAGAYERAASAVEDIINIGMDRAMNIYNTKPKKVGETARKESDDKVDSASVKGEKHAVSKEAPSDSPSDAVIGMGSDAVTDETVTVECLDRRVQDSSSKCSPVEVDA